MSLEKVVLIVDDSPTTRSLVKSLIKPFNLTLREAGGELGLFNLIDEYDKLADLILMDLTLKNEDGFTLINKLKESDAFKNIPVIMLTEHAEMDNVLTAKKLGVNGYIRKPINKDLFIEKLKEVLDL